MNQRAKVITKVQTEFARRDAVAPATPEYFLGNAGTNRKLVAFAERIRAAGADAELNRQERE